jgi:hypothetical protein
MLREIAAARGDNISSTLRPYITDWVREQYALLQEERAKRSSEAPQATTEDTPLEILTEILRGLSDKISDIHSALK